MGGSREPETQQPRRPPRRQKPRVRKTAVTAKLTAKRANTCGPRRTIQGCEKLKVGETSASIDTGGHRRAAGEGRCTAPLTRGWGVEKMGARQLDPRSFCGTEDV